MSDNSTSAYCNETMHLEISHPIMIVNQVRLWQVMLQMSIPLY